MKKHDDDQIDLGDPLGLANEPIVTNAADHIENGPSAGAARRRRARALGEDGIEQDHTGTDINADPDGAAGIDMGYGGEGTDVTTTRRRG
ncbi:MAG TPA: hypothetical protein VL173_16955 [Vicinamibacterales bacterium]|jgi:hypothetical protein|nr:hypothetical protein [Vicinamibacterales bacterium]